MATAEFKSPKRKLVDFFRRSRDGWKRKYQESKRRNKQLSNQVRAVEKSRAHWKEVAKEERRKARQLEQQLEELKRVAC
jgi:predicted  nucleic acid-binding Zn-ribbon protein